MTQVMRALKTPSSGTAALSVVAARPTPSAAAPNPFPRLTITDSDYPVYLTNNNFEVEWCNGPAAARLEAMGHLSDDITERNLFKLFLESPTFQQAESWDELVHFHLALAKNRLSKDELRKFGVQVGHERMATLERVYDDVKATGRLPLQHTEVNLAPRKAPPEWHDLYASFFREGIVFACVPSGHQREGLLQILSRREIVIRDVLKKRRPYLTPLAVVTADLQGSMKICAGLPPEEYFELINTVWSTMEPFLRKYYGTHGKHVGDGMLCYFFPQPDCSYLMNALHCASAMKRAMQDVDLAWRRRKNWSDRLVLNIGVHEGDEWFGTFETPTHLQFTVLGETVNNAARLSDFARDGTIWTTKSLLSKLKSDERKTVRYGIRRRDATGDVVVANVYARVADLIDLGDPRAHKLHDIATLSVAEIHDMGSP